MTHKNKIRKIKNRRLHWLRKYKAACGCEICGYDESHPHFSPLALDFAHRNPLEKHRLMTLNSGGNGMQNLIQRIATKDMAINTSHIKELFVEMRKCKILCKNCHVIETEKEFNGIDITKIRGGSYKERKHNLPVEERGNLEAFF